METGDFTEHFDAQCISLCMQSFYIDYRSLEYKYNFSAERNSLMRQNVSCDISMHLDACIHHTDDRKLIFHGIWDRQVRGYHTRDQFSPR